MKKKLFVSFAVLFSFLIFFDNTLNASITQQDAIRSYFKGISINNIKSQIGYYANKMKISEEQLTTKLYKSLYPNDITKNKYNTLASSNTIKNFIIINKNQIKHNSDLFYEDANTSFFNHGHVGIIISKKYIIEAPGVRKKSLKVKISSSIKDNGRKFTKGSKLLSVLKLSEKERLNIENYASKYLINKPFIEFFGYPDIFQALFRDKKDILLQNSMDCSQLVWKAFKKGANLDIVPKVSKGITPNDILNSKENVNAYKIL